MKINNNLLELAKIFYKSKQGELYVVGGAIRNYLLKKPITDVDICSKLSIDEVMEILTNTKFIVKIKNALTQTALIMCDNKVFEYARFRKEHYNSQGDRVPSQIEFTDKVEEDYLRRDFTCNCIYYDIINAKLIDFCGGKEHIKNKILDTVLEAKETLSYDSIRLLRLVRFSLQYNLTPTDNVIKVATANSHLLSSSKGQAKKEELTKILTFGTDCKNYYDCNYKKLHTLLLLNYIPYIFSSKLKRIQFSSIDIKQIFPLSLNCNNPSYALTCFILDLYSYILSKQIFIDKEIIELLLNQSNLNFSGKDISYLAKLCSAYTYDKIISQPRFYIYLNNEILNDIINVFNFNKDNNIVIKTINNQIKAIKHDKLPLSVRDLKITSKEIYDAKLVTKTNINYILKRVHYAVLFEQIKNNKQDIISFISKNFK